MINESEFNLKKSQAEIINLLKEMVVYIPPKYSNDNSEYDKRNQPLTTNDSSYNNINNNSEN